MDFMSSSCLPSRNIRARCNAALSAIARDNGDSTSCGVPGFLLIGVTTATSLGVDMVAKGEKSSRFLAPAALIAP